MSGAASSLKAWARAIEMTAPLARDPHATFPAMIEDLADRFGEAPALLSDEESLSYRALAGRANQYARWGLAQGVGPGGVVCLMLANCPDYIAIWVGLTRIGAVVALINTNLVDAALAHAINVAGPQHIIAGSEFADAAAAIRPLIPADVQWWSHGGGGHDFTRVDHAAQYFSEHTVSDAEHPLPRGTDRALCIYTSGTTGLPKAANVSHHRLMQWSLWFAGMIGTTPDDRMYDCLPLYHSVGGVVAIGATLAGGGSVVLRRRFSARHFWSDIARWDCTLFQYIGELCRYLVNAPPDLQERAHRLRLCCGNGLRPDVWERFKERFAIPRILEFYASTEGNFSLCNHEGEPGSIGRIPSFLVHRVPVALIKLDGATGEPARGPDGFCERCGPGEAGEAIGQILGDRPATRFEGYTDAQASERKVLRDVFEKGDAWLRTGDLMRKDSRGFFYFVDRAGDSYRWKGENVSAAEVAETIAACPGVVQAVAYGVAVPGTEGRAGMAAIVPGPDFALAALHRHLAERLPGYARPLFLRLCARIEATATFKPRTAELARDGYDPAAIRDALYFDDRERRSYVPLDTSLHGRIEQGEIAL